MNSILANFDSILVNYSCLFAPGIIKLRFEDARVQFREEEEGEKSEERQGERALGTDVIHSRREETKISISN